MKRTALITGATSGIGKATADVLARNGWDLILTGRRSERLDELKSSLTERYAATISNLSFDIQSLEETEKALETIPNDRSIDVLINNAGLAAGKDPIHEGNLSHWERMIDTNVKGLLYITRIIAPRMIQQQAGHIINVGSTAGKEVYENGNVYCATKHAVDALSKAMRIDLNPHSIKVTNIAPGLVETEFSIVRFDGDKEKANRVYQGFEPLSAEDIADCIHFAVSRPPHVNIGDMLILPTAQANSTTIKKN